MLEFLWDVNYSLLGFAATHTADFYSGFTGVDSAPHVEGFAVAFAAFIGDLNCVNLHGG